MDRQLYVRIENKSLVPFFNLDKDRKRSLSLTTLKDGQRTAVVTIYRKDRNGREIALKQYTVSPLPLGKAGEPKIFLESRKIGPRSVEIQLHLNRRRIASDSFKLPGKGGIWWWLLGALLALLLGLLAFILLRPAPLPEGSAAPAPQTTSAAESQPEATPEPEPPPKPEPESESDTPAPAETTEEASTTKIERLEESPPETEESGSPELVEPLRRTVYFEPDNALLTEEARSVLASLVVDLEEYSDLRIRVRGHCAVRGTEEGRQELSEQRAENTADYLRTRGLRVENSRGLGAEEPITLAEDDQYLNRRVEIIVEGE